MNGKNIAYVEDLAEMRKTKIICTLGPATDDEKVLEQLINSGMNVARLNFSHGLHEEHAKRIKTVREYAKKSEKPVAVLLDTKGPEIRIGDIKDGKAKLKTGQKFTLTADEIIGDETKASLTFADLYKDVRKGDIILIDDGLISLQVDDIKDKDIICTVQNDGAISNHKGVNVPNVHINMPYMSEKDKQDILFGIEQDVDFIAASFVRSAEDLTELRAFLNDNGGKAIHIISKIENEEGVRNIDEIIEKTDAVMIARGDMGVELLPEKVPAIQKMIINKVNAAGKPVVTATQMLDSMMKNPRPTRAETADVANAVYDGTSAVMLSGETAAGKYPVEALQMMARIIECTEMEIDYRHLFFSKERKENSDITDAICHATCTTAYDLKAAAIVTVTKSGYSAKMISRYRPESMIIGGTINEKVERQLNLAWGVYPILLETKDDVMDLFDHAVDSAEDMGYIEKGQRVVITAGIPLGKSGTTNMVKVQVV